jgi:hypothetical protein
MATSLPSVQDGQNSSVPPACPPVKSTPSSPAQRPISEKKAKLDLADQARLIQDNARTLQTTVASDKALRQQTLQLRQAQLTKTLAELGQDQPEAPVAPAPEDDMGDINIDSPTTVHYHYAASPAPVPPVAPPMPPAPPCPAEPGYDAVYEQMQPDGTWKLIRREKLT